MTVCPYCKEELKKLTYEADEHVIEDFVVYPSGACDYEDRRTTDIKYECWKCPNCDCELVYDHADAVELLLEPTVAP